MAIGTPTVHLTGDDNTTATSYGFTATGTPVAGSTCFAFIRASRAGTAAVPLSFSAYGLTWTQINNRASASGNVRLTVYEAKCTMPSASFSVTVDLNDGGGNHTGCSCTIVSHATANKSHPTNRVSTTATGLSVTATLPSGVTAGNGVGSVTMSVGNTTLAEEAGYTEAVDYAIGTLPSRLEYQWRSDNADSTPTTTAGTSRELLVIAFEIVASATQNATATMAGAGAMSATATLLVEPDELATAAARYLASHDAAEVALVLWIDGLGIGFTTSHDVSGLQYYWGLATSGQFQTGLRGGLKVMGSVERTIELFAAQIQPSSLTFDVLDYDEVLLRDMFGEGRTDIGSTHLAVSADADDTTITVDSALDVPESPLYVGLETLDVSAWNIFTGALTVTRGAYSLFPPAGGTTWSRSHEVPPAGTDPPAVTDPPEVTTRPINWVNREVGLYLCHKVGGVWSAGFPGTVVGNDAELLWAGRIKHYSEDGQGWISLDCVEITEKLLTSVGTRMYEGTLVEGTQVSSQEADIEIAITRYVFTNHGAIASTDEWRYTSTLSTISGTRVTHAAAAVAVNAAFTDAFVTHSGTYAPVGTGMSLSLGTDPLVSESRYLVTLLYSGYSSPERWDIFLVLSPRLWRLFGYGADQLGRNKGNVSQELKLSSRPDLPGWVAMANLPPRKTVVHPRFYHDQILVTPTNGVPFVAQTSLPDGFTDPATLSGFLMFNETKVAAVGQLSANEFLLGRELQDDRAVGSNTDGAFDEFLDAPDLDDRPIRVRQVWAQPYDSIGEAMAALMCSTGTAGYNGASDTLPIGLGVAFPTSLLDLDGLLALTGVPYTLIVVQPTPAAKFIESALNVLGRHLVWRNSKLSVVDPIGGSGAWSPIPLTEDNKAKAISGEVAEPIYERTTCDRNPESIINRLTLKYAPTIKADKWNRTLNAMAMQSQSDFGQTKAVVIDGYGIDEDAADLWATNVASVALAYFSRPVALCTRSFDFTLAPRLYPGAVVSVDDDGLIDPTTGTRGVEGLSAWVLSVVFDWATAVGTVKFVFQPRAA